jgi:oligopeptidase B
MPVLGGYDPKQYRSSGSTPPPPTARACPISLVYKGTGMPRNRPLLLLGYGSHGVTSGPYFHPDRLSMLDRGMVYGIAHIRGGGELGEVATTASS